MQHPLMTRIIFMGSPEFAVPTLQRLTGGGKKRNQSYEVVGVVTQPDRPSGRGRQLKAPPIKKLALDMGLPLIQPEKIRQPEAMEQIRSWAPGLIVVAAFGQILRPDILELPSFGCVNVHASLLPRWRGAAPIQAAIIAGDTVTGVTIMKMDKGVDTGGIIAQRALPLDMNDTGGTLTEKLGRLGADLLGETLPDYLSGKLKTQAQDDSKATYAPMLKKEDGRLDLTQPAEELARRVRAFNPRPGTFLEWNGGLLKVHQAHSAAGKAIAGQRLIHEGWAVVGTGNGLIVLDEVQPEGKKPMSGKAFIGGARGWVQI